MQPNDKQKRFLVIGIAVLALLYIAPRVISMYHQRQALAALAHRKPSAAIPAPSAGVSPAVTISPVPMGRYQGAGVVILRQCKVDLEVRPAQSDAYAGYLTVMCFVPPHVTSGRFQPGQPNPIVEAARQMTPASAIMTGTIRDGIWSLLSTGPSGNWVMAAR
jgi:hypothetical protein